VDAENRVVELEDALGRMLDKYEGDEGVYELGVSVGLYDEV